MKKGKIALVAIIAAITAFSMANAEITSKQNSSQYPGFYPIPGSEDSLQTDNCCGHKVPKGTCMAVCGGNQFPDLEQIQEGASSPATLETLTGTTEKMSSINMEKNFSEAGNVLASFYSGSKAKGNSDSVVYAAPGTAQSSSAKTEKEICNAKPSKIILAGKVPPLNSTSKDNKKTSNLPLAAGGLVLGGISLLTAAASSKKTSYADDLGTVWNAFQHPIDTYNDIHNYESNMENYNNSTHQNNNSSSNGTGNQNDSNLYGQWWLDQQLD